MDFEKNLKKFIKHYMNIHPEAVEYNIFDATYPRFQDLIARLMREIEIEAKHVEQSVESAPRDTLN